MIRRVVLACLLGLAARAAGAESLQRGVAFGSGILVYTAPNTDAPAAGPLADGDAVIVLEQSATREWLGAEKDYWYRIEREPDLTGWVHGSQLLRGALEGRVRSSGVRMRAGPSTQDAFVRALSAGEWVTVLDRSPEPETIGDRTARWYQVRTGTATGWVYGAYLELALTMPGSAHAPFLGWRCWPGKADQPRPTEAQILAGLMRWRRVVAADIARRLTTGEDAAVNAATQQLARAWEALQAGDAAEATQALQPLTQLEADVATPLGSAIAAAALLNAKAVAQQETDEATVVAAVERAMTQGRGKILTGTDWSAPADLAAFDLGLFLFEREWKDARRARAWVKRVAADGAQSPVVRAAAGAASVRLHFAARRETDAIVAARQVFSLGADAQVLCGPMPVHFGATALTLACDELQAVGGAADAVTLCESVAASGDATLQGVARARLARLQDLGTADVETVIAAYDAVPDFRVRLADLRTVDAGDSAARAAALRALTQRVGASDEAWVTGDHVRLRSLPSQRGAVLAALGRDTVVRLLYRPPPWGVEDERAWVKVRVRGGQIGWMVEDYLELQAPRVAALPDARGVLWSQGGGGADGRAVAPGAEIDAPVVLWRLPDVLSGGAALADANGDGTADLVVTGVRGARGCPRGVAVLDGRTQGEFWRAQTAGCTDGRSVAVGGGLVLVASGAGTLEAFDLRTGGVAWTWTAEGDAAVTAPAVTRDLVAVGATDGAVTVLDLATGRRLVRARVGAPVVVPPAFARGMLYTVTDRHVNALDVRERRPAWRARLIRHEARATAAGQAVGGVAVEGNLVYAVSPGGVLVACDAKTGDARWQVDIGGTPVGGPISDGRRVMVALAHGEVRAWATADGAPEWWARAPGPIASRMLLADHTLVLGSSDGSLIGLSRVDGRERWRMNLGAALDRGPAGGGGRVVIGSSAGPLFVVGDSSMAGAKPAPLRTGVTGGG